MNQVLPSLMLAAALALALAPSGTASAAPAGETRTLASNTPYTTLRGTTFVAPKEWQVSTSPGMVLMSAPEQGSRIAVVESDEAEADAAVAAAWTVSGLGLRWPHKLTTDRTPQDGWEGIRQYEYDVATGAHRYVVAQARKAGGKWTVLLVDLDEAVAEKRAAQYQVVFDRFMPAGSSRESFAGRRANVLDAARLAQLADFVRDAGAALDIPGISVGVVQDGKVVLAEGFGVREQGKAVPVDADTLYMVASNTKAMTTMMLARLVERGRFGWDTPVQALLPGFALGDPETSRRVQVQHLVCACTGLPRQDFEWLMEFEQADAASTLRTLATMQPTSDFGALFQYSNPLASAGGYVGAHVLYPDMELGAAYDRAMQEEVFGPLGMTSTTFDSERALAGNHAVGHAYDADARSRVALMAVNRAVSPVRPAGGAWSNVRDMLRYVQVELDRGRLPDGTRYIGEALLDERLKEKASEGVDSVYGMGLGTDRRWGVPVVHHGGSLIGYKSDMMWLPEHGVGAVVLANSDNGYALLGPFQRRLLEILFDGEPLAAAQLQSAAQRNRAQFQAERKLLVVPAAPSVVAKLAPRYRNPALGTVAVRREGDRTMFDFGEWATEVASRVDEKGTESLRTIAPGMLGLDFVVGTNKNGRTLTFRDSQHEYVFEEVR